MAHIQEYKNLEEVGKCIVCGKMIYKSYEHGSKSWIETEDGVIHKECKKEYEDRNSE